MSIVTAQHVRSAAVALRLANRPIVAHVSMSSFGHLEGGATTLLNVLLDLGCTVITPTFTSRYELSPAVVHRIEMNGMTYNDPVTVTEDTPLYVATTTESDLGAFSTLVASHPDRFRSWHPLNSFSAVGPLAQKLVSVKDNNDVYQPLRAACESGAYILLAGVGYEAFTLGHAAEETAGFTPFRRWALAANRHIESWAVGGCSEGFAQFAPILDPLGHHIQVGASQWTALHGGTAITALASELWANPQLSLCKNIECERCCDRKNGGPLIPELTF